MLSRCLRAFLVTCSTLASFACVAFDYKPFDGFEGYQDIKISNDVYYVGYHGSRNSSFNEVVLAWSARSAQLCEKAGAPHYVELAYIFEPLTEAERNAVLAMEAEPRLFPAKGGFVYVPIFVPGGPRAASIDAPSKLGPVRCVGASEAVLNKDRLISVQDKLR